MSIKQMLTNTAIKEISDNCEPCPFCGNAPNIFKVRDDRYVGGEMNWVIECKDMGCVFKRTMANRSLDALLDDWNRRDANRFWINV